MKVVKIEFSKSGLPCLWENGGGSSNTGQCKLISNKNGEKKKPIYVRNRGELSCSTHALIPICIGDKIIESNHHRGDFHHKVFEIENFLGNEAILKELGDFSNGEWNQEFLENNFQIILKEMISTSEEKAKTYHCRNAMFIQI